MNRNRCIALILGFALALSAGMPLSPAGAQSGGGDNTAVAVNTKDGSDVFRLAFQVNRVASDTVDSGNAAVAFASCTDCQTVAIAIQVVLAMSDATEVTPENLAIAVNQGCSACDTLASAYQLVVSTGGRVRLSPEGRKRIAEIRRQLQELRQGELTGAEIQTRVDALTAELRDVVTTQLVPVGRDRETQASPGPSVGPTTPITKGAERGSPSTPSTSTSTSTTSTSTTSTTAGTGSTTAPAP